jgi:methane monooxygenase PmoA-like
MRISRLLLLCTQLLIPAFAMRAASLRVEGDSRPAEWTICLGDQKLLVYAFDPLKFKPYVKELYTTKGDNVLRDAPHDHLHHHALMYGIKVNGLNFWEELPGMGVQQPVQSPRPEIVKDSDGRTQARIAQLIRWVSPQEAFLPTNAPVALLVERRTLTLSVNEARQEVALHWKSQFEVGPKTNEVTLTGANYHGLGMRFLEELDPVAKHLNAGNIPDLSGSKQDVSQGRWGSVSFDAPGKSATIALYGLPKNPGGEAYYFTMKTPFAYLSATQRLDRDALIYRSGEKFELNYLVVLYPGPKSSRELDERGEEWRARTGI